LIAVAALFAAVCAFAQEAVPAVPVEGRRVDTVREEPSPGFSLPQDDDGAPDPDAAPRDGAWTLDYASINSQVDGDAVILILRAPVLRRGPETLRATWAILWADHDTTLLRPRTRQPGLRMEGDVVLDERPQVRRVRTLWDDLDEIAQRMPELRNVREIYLEGPIEYFVADDRVAFADAAYIDMIDRLGWIADANYEMHERVGGSRFVFKVQAGWLRLASDGSLTSNDARLTTCEFAVPHFYITSGRLRLVPTEDPDRPVRVLARSNAIRIGRRLRIPMPPIDGLIDDEGDLTIGGLQVGQSPRFGTVVGLEYNRDVREEFGTSVNRILRGDPEDFRSRLRLSASWLGSRGLLLDLGLRLRSPRIYEWNWDLGFVPDSSRDRGLIRVPRDDRPDVRAWLRSRGRYELERGEWIDLGLSVQTDPGVQAEFFEDDYLRFAERRTYLHWRKAGGADYSSATIGGTLDDFRTEVQQLPILRRERQRVPVLDLGAAPLLYGSSTSVGVFDRTEGDPDYEAPFPDGFGERTLLRGDHTSRLEAPLQIGPALSLVPFLDGRLTGWSESGEDGRALGRSVLSGGSRLSSLFWRETSGGGVQQILPSIEYRRDIVDAEGSGTPIDLLDDVEAPQTGQFVTGTLRGRWFGKLRPIELDGGVRVTYGSELEDQPDGWLPIGTFARLDSKLGNVPIAATHDSRHDLETNETVYSRTQVGVRPFESLDLTFGFLQGYSETFDRDFEVATFGALYRFSPKWEFEGRQQLSVQGDDDLDSRLTLRRFGHDIVFELSVADRAGEGTSIGMRVRPILSAKRRPAVLLPD
jgi:hypothetical protein